MQLEQGKIECHEAYSGGYRRLDVRCPAVGKQVQPGQFVHVKIPGRNESLLRRPFSVFKAGEQGLSILYKPVGRGTETLATLTCGTELDVLGPLGNGFPEPQEASRPVLVAGGYGMAALYLCAARFPQRGVAFFGGASANDILCVEEFEALGWEVQIATNDGSRGSHGLVTEPLQAWLQDMPAATQPEFFVCGPNGMLKAVSELAAKGSWTSWLSVDRNMGCGVGACLACVQKIFRDDGSWEWLRVCREGPVFEGQRVCWDEEGATHTCGGKDHD